MSVRDRAILGSSDLEPDENTTWQCPECGKFTSDRTAEAQHGACFEAAEDAEIMDLRAHVEGW